MTLLVVLRLLVEPLVELVELSGDPTALLRRPMRVRPVGRQHRVERERNEQRHRHRARDRQRERLEPLAADARHEADRHEHRENRERRRRDGEADLVGAVVRRAEMVFPHLDVPHDVLTNHDRVVDQNADRERQSEQRHRLELEAERPHRDEAREHRHRQRDTGDDGRPPRIQEQEHDEHREHGAEDQRFLHVAHRVIDARSGVLHQLDLRALGQRLLDLSEPIAHHSRDVGRAVAVRLLDVDADRFLAVVERERARLLGRVLDRRHLAETRDHAVAVRDDEVVELRRVLETAAQANRALVERTVHPANRRREVLRLQRADDLCDADVRRLQLVRIDLDGQLALHLAEDLHVGHALHRAQLARDAGIGETRELRRRQDCRRNRDRDDRPIRVVELLDDRLLHLRRQIGANGRNRVAHFLRRDVHVLAEQELDHDHRIAVVGFADDSLDARDRADLLLDRLEHLALDDVWRRAGIDDAHGQELRRDVRELVRLQLERRERPEDHQRDHRHDGDERTLDCKI